MLAGAVLRAGGDAHDVARLRDPRVEWVRGLSVAARDTLFPGSDAQAGARHKAGPKFMANLRRLYTDVPAPDAVLRGLNPRTY